MTTKHFQSLEKWTCALCACCAVCGSVASAAPLQIEVRPVMNGEPLMLDSLRYQNSAKETFSVTRLSFLLSGFALEKNDGGLGALAKEYHTANEGFLREKMNKDTTVLIPGYPTRELERILRSYGFYNIVRTVDGEELALGPNLKIAIHVETSITDGPGGDSAIVISDGTGRLVNQNDCRTNDLLALRNHGPVDLHWLQYSGAIWYPMVYQETPERMRELIDAKVDSQFSRAMRYVETIGARAVVPSAGPPAFLDPELFQFNVIDGDELSIFPDQRVFMRQLADAGHVGVLAIPGTAIDLSTDGITVIPDKIQIVNDNVLILHFNTAQAGRAVCIFFT